MKREVRCKSGAIPVAVNPQPRKGSINQLKRPLSGRMGRQVEGEPEDLPVSINHFTLSGEKQEMYRLYRLYTSTYFVPKAVTEKLNLQ